jgi:hypothetical protein
MATQPPERWIFNDPRDLGLDPDLRSTHSFFTYVGAHGWALQELDVVIDCLAHDPDHPYKPRLIRSLNEVMAMATEADNAVFSCYGGQVSLPLWANSCFSWMLDTFDHCASPHLQVHTPDKTAADRLEGEHETGHGSGTSLFADVLHLDCLGPCHFKFVVFKLEVYPVLRFA